MGVSVLSLPYELLAMVAQDLASRDVSSFARSCHFLHATLTPILYRSVRDDGNLLLWAAHMGRVGTAEKLLAAGAQPDAALRQREPLGLHDGAALQKFQNHGMIRNCTGSRAQWPCANGLLGAMFYCCTALHLAARAGHDDVIDVLLRSGADINAPSRGVCDCFLPYIGGSLAGSDGTPFWTALHTAICHNNEASAELLISRGASFNVASWDEPAFNIQVTALHSASAVGALDICKSLMRHYQPDVNTEDHNGFSPVSWAYLAGRGETMKLLLDSGADVNANAGYGRSLLVDACATGRFKEAYQLLELGANVRYVAPEAYITALHYCCNQKQSDTISSKFRNVKQFTSLEDWARLAKALLKAGADVNARDMVDETTPIMRASHACFPPIVRVLLANGADVNDHHIDGTTPLLAACLQWKNDPVQFWQMTVQTLLENGADVNVHDTSGTTPLLAICNSRMCIFPDSWLETLQLLLEHGADVNARNKSGTSPILAVCGLRHGVSADPWQVSVELLLEHGASIEYCDNPAGTVIEALCPTSWRSRPSRITQDQEPLVKLLLERGASPDASSVAMESPMCRFFLDSSLSISKLLLDHGARPPKPTELRRMINHAVFHDDADALKFVLAFEGAKKLMATKSRLYMALKRGAHNVAEILLDEGAPYLYRGRDGGTCLFHACAKGNKNVAKKLLAAGESTETYHRNGHTPLSMATARQDFPVVELLLDHGANAHFSGASGRSPFLLAVNGSQTNLVQAMVRRGALERATLEEHDAYMQKYEPGDSEGCQGSSQDSGIETVPDETKPVQDFAAYPAQQTINPLDSMMGPGIIFGNAF